MTLINFVTKAARLVKLFIDAKEGTDEWISTCPMSRQKVFLSSLSVQKKRK